MKEAVVGILTVNRDLVRGLKSKSIYINSVEKWVEKIEEFKGKTKEAAGRLVTTCLETKLVSERLQRCNEEEDQFIERNQVIERILRLEYKFQAQTTEIKHEWAVVKIKLEIAELNLGGKFESEKISYLKLENQRLMGK